MKQIKPRTAAVVGALFLSSTMALAGLKSPVPVTVTANADGSGNASGSMTTARFSSNSIEYVGCGLRYIADTGSGATRYGWCQARTAGNVVGICSTSDPTILEVVAGLANYSFITFAWDSAGTCTRIGLSTQSQYIP